MKSESRSVAREGRRFPAHSILADLLQGKIAVRRGACVVLQLLTARFIAALRSALVVIAASSNCTKVGVGRHSMTI